VVWGNGEGTRDVLVCVFCCVVFMFKSNVGLCVSVYVSFVCSFCLLRLCVWKRSRVFNRGPFFGVKYVHCRS
jgi:hypothetical protein